MFDRQPIAGHDDAFEEQPHEALSAGEVEGVQPVSQGFREGGEIVGDARDARSVHLLAGQLVATQADGVHGGLEAFAPRLQLFDAHGPPLVGIEESLNLDFELAPSGLEPSKLLGDARRGLTTVLPCFDFALEHLRTLDPGSNRVPNDAVELVGAHTLRRALGRAAGVNGVAPIARIVEVLVAFARARLTRATHLPSTLAARDERAQQVLVAHVARRPALVLRQAGSDALLFVLGHQRRNRYVQPLPVWTHDVRALRVLAIGAGPPRAFRFRRLSLAVGRHPRIGRVRQNDVHAARDPHLRPARPKPERVHPLRHLACAQPFVEHPSVDRPDVLRLDLVDNHDAAGCLLRSHDRVSVRCRSEREHAAFAHLVHAPSPGALEDLGPLVLRNHALHLHQEAIFRALANRVLHEAHLHAPFGQLFEHDLLMHVASCKPIRAVDVNDIHEAVGRGVAKGIEAWSIQTGPAEALVDVAPIWAHRDTGRHTCQIECFKLRLDRLLLLLTRGRHSRIQSYSLVHPSLSSSAAALPCDPRAASCTLVPARGARAPRSITSFTA